MQINLAETLLALSYALDCVEHEVIGVSTHHGKRVAAIAAKLGQSLLLTENECIDLAGCAVMHDCALTEYVHEYFADSTLDASAGVGADMGTHCTLGEAHIAHVPFLTKPSGAVRYHHENADGSGAFGLKYSETPLFARLIHIADTVDAKFDLSVLTKEKFASVGEFVRVQTGRLFDEECAGAFLSSFDYEMLSRLSGGSLELSRLLDELIPPRMIELSPAALEEFSDVFIKIVDYKSRFTRSHSLGVAQRSRDIAGSLGYGAEKAAMLYFAGALHDIGKLAVDSDILEKPGKLTNAEYSQIQSHAKATYDILSPIEGFEKITALAALHHEKLDGSGYPFGMTGVHLTEGARIIAVCDIYQALVEERPYKRGLTHADAMEILNGMAVKGQLDSSIVAQVDKMYAVK